MMNEGYSPTDIVDVDIYRVGAGQVTPFEALEQANEPLSLSRTREYWEELETDSDSVMRSHSQSSADDILAEIGEDYHDHISDMEFRLIATYEDGNEIEYTGRPRHDLDKNDFRTAIFPSIIPFSRDSDLQNANPRENPSMVLRVMEPYSSEVEKSMPKDSKFAGENSYDWEFSDQLGTVRQAWNGAPDNFSYIDEPRDFLAIHGYDGLHESIEDTEVPMIASPEWAVMAVDEDEERIAGLRPFYHEIWDAGLNKDDAELIGQWRGANRGWGRWIHDMDGEFFYGIGQDQRFIGFYDNEMPFAVGDDKAFETNIRGHHRDVLQKFGGEMAQSLQDTIISAEEETKEKIDQLGLKYHQQIPRTIKSTKIPGEMRVDEIF